jgi:hypothetical protein
LSEEDRKTYEITKEWLRFDEAELDDLDSVVLSEYEAGLGNWFSVLDAYDKPRNTIRWQASQAWMACRMAGFLVPDLHEFRIKIRKVEWKEETAEGGDAGPPDSSSPSTAGARSKKASR